MEGKMDIYFKDQILRISVEFRDNNEDLADPTTIDFSYRVDHGAITAYEYGEDAEIVRDSLGVYYIDVLLDTSGNYSYHFIAGGAIENAIEDTFRVLTALETIPVVELGEAKDYLQVPHTDDDGLIQGLLLGIESTIREYLKSTIEATELTQYFNGDTPYILLPNIPIDVTTEGVAFTVYDDIYDQEITDSDMFRVVPTTGHVYYNNEAQRWPEGIQRYRITYTGGLAVRDDYNLVLYRIKTAELTWLSDLYYNRKASNTWEKFDDIEERKELEYMPKRVETFLVGLVDVTNDF
jgi:hypothetical protein